MRNREYSGERRLLKRAAIIGAGHSSVMTGLMAGMPAVIIPIITDRESNARRIAVLGAGEVVIPTVGAVGESALTGLKSVKM